MGTLLSQCRQIPSGNHPQLFPEILIQRSWCKHNTRDDVDGPAFYYPHVDPVHLMAEIPICDIANVGQMV